MNTFENRSYSINQKINKGRRNGDRAREEAVHEQNHNIFLLSLSVS